MCNYVIKIMATAGSRKVVSGWWSMPLWSENPTHVVARLNDQPSMPNPWYMRFPGQCEGSRLSSVFLLFLL